MFPAAKDLQPIAQVLKSYGTDGGTIVSFLSGVPEDIDYKEPVFLVFEGLPVPFFIESLEAKGNNKAFVKFEDIDTLDQAEEITGMQVYEDTRSDSDSDSDDGLCVEDLIGFTLLDQHGHQQGIIEDVLDFSGNICLSLPGERLIPFHDELVNSVDEEAQTISLTIPEGI